MSITKSDISMDARVLITGWFAWGDKTSVKIGGEGAQSVLSDRAEPAMQELISKGLVTAHKFNNYGRMQYVGTPECAALKLSQKDMEKHGRWSATKPNPVRGESQ